MEAEEGRGTHERARRNDAEGLSPFSLQGRMMVVGRFEIVIRPRSPGPYLGIYRKPIWHLRIQRLSNVVVEEQVLQTFSQYIFLL